jgi:RNA polymerase sigma-70 factor (ECF subfamily)
VSRDRAGRVLWTIPIRDDEPMTARSSAVVTEISPRASGVVPIALATDEVALVAQLRENHPGAKTAFFQTYSRYVERLVTHTIGFDRELADIIQEVFLNAFRSLPKLEDATALRPWLARVAVNTARKVLRTRSRRAWLRLFRDPDDEFRAQEPVAAVDQDVIRALRSVYDVLHGLPADESIAFALRFIEGMDLTEVADACDVSLATIKRRLRRAEQRFVAAARSRPELDEWLKGGSRWQDP